MAEGVRQMRVLERNGLEIRIVDAGQVALLEPALAPVAHKLLGGVYVPTDGTGDARLFTAELARVTESQGVRYLYNTEVKSIEVERGAARAVHTSEGKIEADAIVVAMGSYSAQSCVNMAYEITSFLSKVTRSQFRSPTHPKPQQWEASTRTTCWRSLSWATGCG
jgi:glycine/D-amino acid oxidase-like deaminating enzyme